MATNPQTASAPGTAAPDTPAAPNPSVPTSSPGPTLVAGLTTNAMLFKPATAQRYWDVALNANADTLDGIAAVGQLLVTTTEVPSATLNVRVTAGTYGKGDGTVGIFPGVASYALLASATTCLWLTDAGILSGSVSFPTTAHVRLAQVVTGASAVQSVLDARFGPRTSGSGLGFVLKTGDTVTGPFAVVSPASDNSVFTLAPDVPSLGFFGASPATQAPPIPPLADQSTGTASATITDVGGSYSQTILDNNFASLAATVNDLIAALKRHGLMSN